MDLEGLTKEDEQRIKDNRTDLILHPVGEGQDSECMKIFYESDGHGSGTGKWGCVLKKEQYGDISHGGGSENTGYLLCDCSNYRNCPELQ